MSHGNSGIGIKGNISTNTKSGILKSLDTSASLADARKVMIFSANTFSHGMYYEFSDIDQGAFTVYSQIGFATALVFLDSDNKYIGNLCTEGLNMLPLTNLSDGESTVIDLSTLSLSGNQVIPSHDPFGNEIIIAPQEIEAFRTSDAFYSSLSKNIDADNNGTPDVLEHSEIVASTMLFLYGGHFGTDNSQAQVNDTSLMNFNYQMHFQGGTALTFSNGNISLSGPSGNPYSNIQQTSFMVNPNEGVGFYAQFSHPIDSGDVMAGPFRSGLYTLTLDGSRSYSIYYSSVSSKKNLILEIPTLHIENGQIISVSLKSMLIDGTVINPAVMLSSMLLQFYINGITQIPSSPLTNSTGFETYVLSSPIDFSKLTNLAVTYDDLLGNRYLVNWNP